MLRLSQQKRSRPFGLVNEYRDDRSSATGISGEYLVRCGSVEENFTLAILECKREVESILMVSLILR